MKMKLTHVLTAALVLLCCIFAAGCVQTADENGIVPTDYSNPDNWLLQDKYPVQEVDLFYIYPTIVTVATEPDGGAAITDDMKKGAKQAFLVQGSAFAEYCNVYAPYYRQIAFERAAEILDHYEYMDELRSNEPKADIYAAIDYYFKNLNKNAERPFIIAGHSQGSAMVMLVLEGYMKEHPEYYKNMVAAYPIGWGVTQDWLDANPHLKFAEGETDTGVIVSWNTEIPGASAGSIVLGNDTKVINPLTWTTDETYADKSLNKGSQVKSGSEETIIDGVFVVDTKFTLKSGLDDARVDNERGALICTTENDEALPAGFYNGILGDGSLHTVDYSAYYQNIRNNGFDRIESYLGYKPLVGIPMDYSDEDNWMFQETNPTEQADLFFVYPTADMENARVITDIDASIKQNIDGDDIVVVGTTSYVFRSVNRPSKEVKDAAAAAFDISAAAFKNYTNVFAPYYRQVPIDRAVECTLHNEYIELLRDSRARTDIFASLDYYFENLNKGAERPFILAGHSQGSAMLQVILDDYMAKHPEYYKNMVAAYVVGYGTEQQWFDKNPHLKFAEGETDTGVVISWNTEGPGAKQYSMLIGENAKVINPLTWTTDETYAGISENKGSQIKAADGTYIIVPGIHDAQVDNTRHSLICTTDTNYIKSTPNINITKLFAEKSLHGSDYSNYFANIAENGKKRIDAFLGQKNTGTVNPLSVSAGIKLR